MTIRIVTDGAADIFPDLADAVGIRTVPGEVHLGGEAWQGTREAFWRTLRTGAPAPSSAAPTTDAFAAAYAGAEHVIAVVVSAELSRTFEHACRAADPGIVEVVDSQSVSVGVGLVALAAARAAALEADVHRFRTLLHRLVSEVHVYAVIQDVDYLVRGGRAGLVAADARRDRPQVIAVRRHAIPIGEAHNRKTAIRRLLDHVTEHAGHGVHDWAVGHGDAADVDAFAAAVENRFGRAPAYVTTLGPPVGTHLGPDSLVLGFLAAR